MCGTLWQNGLSPHYGGHVFGVGGEAPLRPGTDTSAVCSPVVFRPCPPCFAVDDPSTISEVQPATTWVHQDPRYFRRGHGSGWIRFAYSAGQIFFTHGDSGHTQINFSEIGGNASAVAISMAYYPDHRNVSDAISALGTQLAVDMASNILKEFEPDITRKFSRKHRNTGATGQ
jgi:hypothetical protein